MELNEESRRRLDTWFFEYRKERGHNPTWGELHEMADLLMFEQIFGKEKRMKKGFSRKDQNGRGDGVYLSPD